MADLFPMGDLRNVTGDFNSPKGRNYTVKLYPDHQSFVYISVHYFDKLGNKIRAVWRINEKDYLRVRHLHYYYCDVEFAVKHLLYSMEYSDKFVEMLRRIHSEKPCVEPFFGLP